VGPHRIAARRGRTIGLDHNEDRSPVGTRREPVKESSVAVPGGRLHVSDRGDGPSLVLLHAGIVDSRAWEPVATRLAAAGYRVVAFDRRGTGESTTDDIDFSHRDDVRRVMDALGVPRLPGGQLGRRSDRRGRRRGITGPRSGPCGGGSQRRRVRARADPGGRPPSSRRWSASRSTARRRRLPRSTFGYG
jgi:hypothetical protein